ncbi:hypothetical protein ERW49_17160 [Aliivibrio finisterrensis]|uniref:Oligosaccharide repeat unit polymerase n=1 Tax=Aliivibrio finisterrensis TaxID=511998 RepID=A0A4Q5KDF2_9GAMM|nr:hypothetical protein [Aliivibrio finisterrensis]RYU44047.1 hypothetical protein ERW49_17160 [Aliivibrio finisterrensis]
MIFTDLRPLFIPIDIDKSTLRSFGFTDGVSLGMPAFQGAAVCIAHVLFKITKKKIYIVVIPVFLMTIAVNARTGFVVIFIAIAVYNLLPIFRSSYVFKIILLVVSIILYANVINFLEGYFYIEAGSELTTMYWVIDGIVQLNQIISMQSSTTTDEMYHMIRIPEDTSSFWLGTGHDIFSAIKNSDLGYVNYLFYGGITFSIILYGLFFYLYSLTLTNVYNRYDLYILTVVCVSIFVLNLKGRVFHINPMLSFLFLINFYYIFRNRIRFNVYK